MKPRAWGRLLVLLSALLVGVLAWSSHPAQAQEDSTKDTRWQTFANVEGVTAIGQTWDGALWFGTVKGSMVRYDGQTWESHGLVGASAYGEVSSVWQDRAGRLWAPTLGSGVRYLPPGTSAWQSLTAASTEGGLPSDTVQALLEDQNGALWFGTDAGVSRLTFSAQDGSTQWLTYATADGLASDRVTGIAQDRDGALWFGTADAGVSRFVQGEWTTLTTADGLVSDRITSMWLDRDGTLWFGTPEGASRLTLDGAGDKGQWRTFTAETTQGGLGCNEITAMLQDRQGALWFGTMDPATSNGCGLSRYATVPLGEETWQRFAERDNSTVSAVSTIFEDRDGGLWFGTHNRYMGTVGPVGLFDDRAWYAHVPDWGLGSNWVTAIHRARNGDLWFGHSAGMVSRTSAGPGLQAGPASRIYTARDGLIPADILSIVETEDGGLWAGTEEGLNVLDGEMWHTELDDAWILALAAAPQGGLWIGTDGGLYHLDGRTSRPVGSDEYQVSALASDDLGRLWMGTWGDGIHVYAPDSQELQVFTMEDGLANDEVSSILIDAADQVWVGHYGGLISHYDGQTWTTHTLCEEAGEWWETRLVADRAGRLWAGAWELWGMVGCPLRRYEAGQWHPVAIDADGKISDQAVVVPLYADEDGAVWFGSIGRGALHYDGVRWSAHTTLGPLANSQVRAGIVDREGGIWLGTNGGGVTYAPPGASLETGEGTVVYSTADGLASNYVVSLLQDSQGALWFGTGNPDTTCEGWGVTRYDGKSWQTFTIAHGLSDNYVGTILEDAEGHIWFGTGCPKEFFSEDEPPWGGATRYDPSAPPDQAWRTYTTSHGLKGHYVQAMGQDQAEALLFATDEGISRYTKADGVEQWQTMTTTLQAVTAMLTDRAGTLWFGGTEGSVAHYWPDEGHWKTFAVVKEQVTALLQDRQGTIWAASQSGVVRYDGERLRIFNTQNSGLGDDRVNDILETEQGQILLLTDLWYTAYKPALPLPQVTIDTFDGTAYTGHADLSLPYRQADVQVQLLVTDMHTPVDSLGLSPRLTGPGGQCQAGDVSPDGKALVECTGLEPDAAYTLSMAAGNGNLDYGQPASLSFAVRPEPVWAKLWFWPAVGGVLVLAGVPTGISGYIWWRTRPRKYADYVLSLSPSRDGHVKVTMEAQGQPAGESDAALSREKVERLVSQVGEGRSGKGLLEYLGRNLCEALFAPGQLTSLRRPARLRLDFSAAPDLTAWPWELASDASGLGFLGQRADTALVRFVSMASLDEKPLVSKRLRVLVVVAHANDKRIVELGLAQEKARLDRALGEIRQVELDYLLGVHAANLLGETANARDLPDQLVERLAEGWDVVHFLGHAGPDLLGLSDEVVLWLEDRRGDYLALGSEDLAVMLGGLAGEGKAPKLVVLNACRTADVGSRLTQAILENGVGAVVGMQWPVLDAAAQAFAEGFYRTLVQHGQVDYAVSVGRNRIASQVGQNRRDWAAPVLVMRVPDGIIFRRV